MDPLEEMYEIYKKPIYNFLYRCTYNPHTAEELTHDTFLKAFKSFPRFRGEASIKTWLFRIARNTYLHYKEKKIHQKEEQYDPTIFDYSSPHDEYCIAQEKIVIHRVMKQLTEKERTIILLRDWHGFSYKEMGDLLQENEGQVKVGLHRARKKFREMYTRECGEERT